MVAADSLTFPKGRAVAATCRLQREQTLLAASVTSGSRAPNSYVA